MELENSQGGVVAMMRREVRFIVNETTSPGDLFVSFLLQLMSLFLRPGVRPRASSP